MSAGLRTLLARVIDYAGLFPPAKLPLDQAIRNYARYRQEPEAWMLGRFVIPAARLAELRPFVEELFASAPPLTISALGRGGSGMADFVANFRADLDDIHAFRQQHGGRAQVDAYEVRLPSEGVFLHSCAALMRLLSEAAPLLRTSTGPVLCPAYEIASGSWRPQVAAMTDRDTLAGFGPFGLKLRCGGLEAAAFPPPEQVASIIAACRDAGVPLKFTAGLHHPVRHFDAGLQTRMHGFLNVFVAGVLAHARRLGEEQVRQIIEDEDAAHFRFDDAGLHWNDLHASTDEIAAARRELVTSFGSCSFDEPCADLRALGFLQ